MAKILQVSSPAASWASWQATAVTLLLAAGGVLSGCTAPDELDTTYGTRSRGGHAQSVNGTHVLSEMFRQAGSRVSASQRLGRAVEQADAVVWFPNRFRPPEEAVRVYFESWLRAKSGRVLVYVARDFDASIVYWERVLVAAAPDQALEVRRRLAHSKAAHEQARSGFEKREECDWFAVRRDLRPRRVTTLAGPWSAGVDAASADIRIFTRLQTPAEVQGGGGDVPEEWFGDDEWTELLTSEDELLAGRHTSRNWRHSKLILVTNGSWLLNATLVNHEHRKLAGRLIAECGSPGRVVFLESGPGGPRIAGDDGNGYHGLVAFTVWPVNCILMHLTMLGVLFCCYAFPIFGRPQAMRSSGHSDFGRHIRALGKLLMQTEDAGYARRRLSEYHEKVKSDTLHAPPLSATRTADKSVSDSPFPSAPDDGGRLP